ncbi:hypothetical protein GA0115236_119420 [Streptomyces sp. IgraMP-1]|nr:hypothetical protein GA0115236_119420 [Streptomyces sp. IgraMP-1]
MRAVLLQQGLRVGRCGRGGHQDARRCVHGVGTRALQQGSRVAEGPLVCLCRLVHDGVDGGLRVGERAECLLAPLGEQLRRVRDAVNGVPVASAQPDDRVGEPRHVAQGRSCREVGGQGLRDRRTGPGVHALTTKPAAEQGRPVGRGHLVELGGDIVRKFPVGIRKEDHQVPGLLTHPFPEPRKLPGHLLTRRLLSRRQVQQQAVARLDLLRVEAVVPVLGDVRGQFERHLFAGQFTEQDPPGRLAPAAVGAGEHDQPVAGQGVVRRVGGGGPDEAPHVEVQLFAGEPPGRLPGRGDRAHEDVPGPGVDERGGADVGPGRPRLDHFFSWSAVRLPKLLWTVPWLSAV